MVLPVGATRGRETSFIGLARLGMKGDAATWGRASSVMAHPLARHDRARHQADRKSVVLGKRVSVRVDLGGRRIIKNKKDRLIQHTQTHRHQISTNYRTHL